MNILNLTVGIALTCSVWIYLCYRYALKLQLEDKGVVVADETFEKMVIGRIRLMSGDDFEEFCTFMFRIAGYNAFKSPASHDMGKDIILNNGQVYVECKCYKKDNKITSPTINKLLGACASDGVKKAIFITTSSYTADCYKILDKTKSGNIELELWNIYDLLSLCGDFDRESVLKWLGYSTKMLKCV